MNFAPWLLSLASVYLLLLWTKARLAITRASHESAQPGLESLPKATILQAIRSGDESLGQTLEENLIGLPGYSFLWLVDRDDPVAITTTEAIQRRHPEANLELLFCPSSPEGVNPKTFKLDLAYELVTTPVLLVVDDDTILPETSAKRLVEKALDHAIATGLPCYLESQNAPGILLGQFVNNNAAVTYLSTQAFMEPITINGMCYALKKEDTNPFTPILNEITDDLALASFVRANQGKIFQSSFPQLIRTEVADWLQYSRIMHRWFVFAMVLLLQQSLAQKALIILLHGLPPVILWGIILFVLQSSAKIGFPLLLATLVLRHAFLSHLQTCIFGRNRCGPLGSLFSELLQPLHLLHGAVCKTILWRKRRYKIFGDGKFATA
jgi:ceramide glucosyltransferase